MSVISHGSPGNPVHFRGSDAELYKLLEDREDYFNLEDKDRKQLTSIFANPVGYIPILKQFPKLNICIAHWGSETAWLDYYEHAKIVGNWYKLITLMIQQYPNFYTDISFTMNNRALWCYLKTVLDKPEIAHKVLYGSDFYMSLTECQEDTFSCDLQRYLGSVIFDQIACENPKVFLHES